VAAPVGQHVHQTAGPDGHDRDLADQPAHRLSLGQVGGHHQVMPAGGQDVRDFLGVTGPAGQPERDVPAAAAVPARGRRG
jgi:hypothetical protein